MYGRLRLAILGGLGLLLFVLPQQSASAYTRTQHDLGVKIYNQSCAKCHGLRGEGKPPGTPAHRGGRILTDFKNVAEMARYIQVSMPLDQPGSLSREEVHAVAARILALNGWPPDGVALDGQTAPRLTLQGAPSPDIWTPPAPEAAPEPAPQSPPEAPPEPSPAPPPEQPPATPEPPVEPRPAEQAAPAPVAQDDREYPEQPPVQAPQADPAPSGPARLPWLIAVVLIAAAAAGGRIWRQRGTPRP